MRNFSARETEWMLELDGIELAPFWRRAIAFSIDSLATALILGIFSLIGALITGSYHQWSGPWAPRSEEILVRLGKEDHEGKLLEDIVVPILYFGLLTWKGRGQSPGKRLMKIRVVSLVHRHLSLWHSIERALGYGAAALEAGFGFFQFFIHPYRRCVQDRIAETIVVTESSYKSMQHKFLHPLLPDDGHIPANRIADESLPLETSEQELSR